MTGPAGHPPIDTVGFFASTLTLPVVAVDSLPALSLAVPEYPCVPEVVNVSLTGL